MENVACSTQEGPERAEAQKVGDPKEDARNEGKGKKGNGNGKGTEMPDRICWNFQKGECQHGDKCTLTHTHKPAAGAEAKAKAKPKAAAAILKRVAAAASTFPTIAEATEARTVGKSASFDPMLRQAPLA